MINSVAMNRLALATDGWGDKEMDLTLLKALFCQRGGDKVAISSRPKAQARRIES